MSSKYTSPRSFLSPQHQHTLVPNKPDTLIKYISKTLSPFRLSYSLAHVPLNTSNSLSTFNLKDIGLSNTSIHSTAQSNNYLLSKSATPFVLPLSMPHALLTPSFGFSLAQSLHHQRSTPKDFNYLASQCLNCVTPLHIKSSNF